jgi:5S rRNA maturation endonuclease (ribonuclease M5)
MGSQRKAAQSKRERLEERFEKGLRLLIELSANDVPIIVEGNKDVSALRRLGLTGPIHALAGHSVVSLADELADSHCLLILFDFDRRGGQLTRHLIKQLDGRGVKILTRERHQLRRAFCWRVRVIEGLKPIDKSPKGTKF